MPYTCDHPGCKSTSRTFGTGESSDRFCKKHAGEGMVNLVSPRCSFSGCTKKCRAFDIPGGVGRFCVSHKDDTMINVRSKRCDHPGCTSTSPAFDNPGGKGRFCMEHKEASMVNIIMERYSCETEGCDSRPSFGGTDDKKGRFCGRHKAYGMINLADRRKCDHEGCDKVKPHYAVNRKSKKRFCIEHRTEDMIDIFRKMCKHSGCVKRPVYGNVRNRPLACGDHKEDSMVNVVTILCSYEGCSSQSPSYGNIEESNRYCKTHKLPGMVNILVQKYMKCEYQECSKPKSFGERGGKPRFCGEHKTVGMVNVNSKRCEEIGCDSQCRVFGDPGGKGRFCGVHRKEDMIDVITKRCDTIGCNVSALYGVPGQTVSKCASHRVKGMLRRPKSKCVNCLELAIYGTNWTPKHCETHKTEDDENLIERPCTSCGLLYVLDKENKCENCNPETFESMRLAKQNAVMEYLDSRELHGTSTDTMVDNGACGRERPDRTFEFVDKVVIFECDEHQHRDRQCTCEQTRMVNIGQMYGGVPVYFIRWNPDDYVAASVNKLPETMKKRYKLLGDVITDIKNGKMVLPTALVSVMYLYYDGWSSLADESWRIITPFSG